MASKTSPWGNTPTKSWYLDLYEPRNFSQDESDILFVIPNKFHLRPDLASNALYGSTDYWWVFSLRNANIIKDPIFDFIAGMEIYAPAVDKIRNLT